MKTYTVIALYEDNNQRFATSVEANTPEEAEEAAKGEADAPIIVAGVIEGDHEVVA